MHKHSNRFLELSLCQAVMLILCPIAAIADSNGQNLTVKEKLQQNSDPSTSPPAQVIEVPNGIAEQSSSSTTTVKDSAPGKPTYNRRLELLGEQLNVAVSKGWISAPQAKILRNSYSDLLSQLRLAQEHNFPVTETNELERQINLFNIELSDKIKKADHSVSQSF